MICDTAYISMAPHTDFRLHMEPKSSCILMTGAASGLGRKFMRQISTESKDKPKIIALDRNWNVDPEHVGKFSHEELNQLIEAGGIETQRLDLSVDEQILRLAARLDEKQIAMECLIHCAGVRGLVKSREINNPSDIREAESLSIMDDQTMISTFQSNVWASFSFLRAMIPALRRSNSLYNKKPTVVVMGSRMGSIGYNKVVDGRNSSGAYAYRASKAALNAVAESLSIDVPDVRWLIVHPGRVESRIVSVKEDGAISPCESVTEMMKLLDRQELFGSSAKFVDRFGAEISW